MVEWVNVSSAAIRRIGYDSVTMQMYVDFEDSNPTYTFYRVSEYVFREFVNAPSKGNYYHRYIKNKYG